MVSATIKGMLCIVILIKYKSAVSKTVKDSDRFKVIRHSTIFIDKTLLLQKILKHDFIHLSAPSKFGKTTNLQMIKLFLGNTEPKRDVVDYFVGTKIWEEQNFVLKHMCQHPTIYYNLKPNELVASHRDIVEGLKTSVKHSFQEHLYLLNSSRFGNTSKIKFQKYLDCEVKEFETGLNFLSSLLHFHYQKNVTILIDNFDSYLTKTIFQADLDPTVVSAILFRILDNTVNLNTNVERTIIFNSMSYKLGSQFSGPDKFKTFKFMEDCEFAPFFGFTQVETSKLLERFHLSGAIHNVTKWYGGYKSLQNGCEVLNPWSVLSFIRHKRFDVYWVTKNTRNILFRYLFPHYVMRDSVIPKLLKGGNITITRIQRLTQYEVEMLKEFNTESNTVPDNVKEYYLLLQYFLESGYLSFISKHSKVMLQTKIKLPNREMKTVFELIHQRLTASYDDYYSE